MSAGRPTKLVRDGGTESYSGSGEAGQESGYSNRRAGQAALDAISGGAIVDEPGGNW